MFVSTYFQNYQAQSQAQAKKIDPGNAKVHIYRQTFIGFKGRVGPKLGHTDHRVLKRRETPYRL